VHGGDRGQRRTLCTHCSIPNTPLKIQLIDFFFKESFHSPCYPNSDDVCLPMVVYIPLIIPHAVPGEPFSVTMNLSLICLKSDVAFCCLSGEIQILYLWKTLDSGSQSNLTSDLSLPEQKQLVPGQKENPLGVRKQEGPLRNLP
jgi:hypothetical protein